MTRQQFSLGRTAHLGLGACLIALVILGAAPRDTLAQTPGVAKNVIESINVSSVPGGKVLVKINFKEALAAVPAGFTVTNPPRIAIDLPNTANGLGKNSMDVSEGDVKS